MINPRRCPALLISAPASGQGKTSVTAALARLYTRQGRNVRVFKTGPDFIDPMFLEAASGQPVYQLDLWLVGETDCRRLLLEAAQTADMILVEGVMGLFDGAPSSADLAQTFNLPVVAVIDASAMAETFGALALGMARYRPELCFAGVFANRVAGPGHAVMLRQSLPESIPFWGELAHQTELIFPDRHLGLVQAQELADLDKQLNHLADAIVLGDQLPLPETRFTPIIPAFQPARALANVRIGIARDTAFSFIYQANLDLLSAMGAELVFFSPLRDTVLPDVDSVYLPGGYPELHLVALAQNTGMQYALRQHVAANKPLLAECGGMLYLLGSLSGCDGHAASMCGIMPGQARVHKRLMGLGLQSARFNRGELRSHTFHHSIMETSLAPAMIGQRKNGSHGEAIYQFKRVTASYLHWYLQSCPDVAVELLHPE